MGSMGMDGERPRRESHHVWVRDLSFRRKAPRCQLPISIIADNQQNMRAALALRESVSRSFVAISTDARSAFIQDSQRFVYLGHEALEFVALMRAGAFLQSLQQPLLSREELCEARHRTLAGQRRRGLAKPLAAHSSILLGETLALARAFS